MPQDYSLNHSNAFSGYIDLNPPKAEGGPGKSKGDTKAQSTIGDLPTPEKPFSGNAKVVDLKQPLEVPAEEKEYQSYTNNFAKKYSTPDTFGFVKDRADWGLFVNAQSDETVKPVGQAATDSAKRQGLRPELLFASAMEEGMRDALPKKQGDQVSFSGNEKFPVNGYTNFGLDDFGGNFKDLVKKGFLPDSFKNKFTVTKKVNEKGREVISADFKTVDDALEAKAAVMHDAAEKVSNFAKENKIELSDAAKEFFTLASFNAGEEGARKMIYSFKQQGLLDDDKFLKQEPKSWSGVWKNVMKRIVMANALSKENLFNQQ